MVSIDTSALSAATLASAYALQEAQFKLVDTWLSSGTTTAGGPIHIAAGLSQEALSIIRAPLAGPKGVIGNLNSALSQVLTVSPSMAKVMNELNTTVMQPNIEGIAIFTESEQQVREMDISTSPLVVQSDAVSTTYATDNATPKPRTWTLKGHLAMTMATDAYFVIKPSLLLQRNYLDNCMRSRKPVWFKTYDNQFVQVLISNMTTNWDPKSMNTMAITLTLHEYVPIKVYEGPLGAAAASIVKSFFR